MPLFLQYQKGDFYVTAGVVGNVKTATYNKLSYAISNSAIRGREKHGAPYYLNGLRADAEVRIGYNQVSFFATWGLTDMFVKGHGPKLRVGSFGVSLFPYQ